MLANLGNLLLGGGKAHQAVTHFDRSLALRPDHPDTLFNLAVALGAVGRAAESVAPLAQAAQLVPKDLGVRRALGHAQRVRLAVASAQPAVAVNVLGQVPDDAYPSLLALVAALGEAGEGAATLPSLEAAARATPEDAGLLTLLSQAHSAAGERDAALAAASAAIAASSTGSAEQARAWYQFSRLHRLLPGDAPDGQQLDVLQRTLARLSGDRLQQRADLGFALGKARADRGEATAAFAAYLAANESLRSLQSTRVYDRAAREDEVDRLLELVTTERLARWRAAAVPSSRPVLVVGMPRSGTTLVEQILAAHPDVCAGGERPYLPTRVRALGADGKGWLAGLAAADTPAPGALAAGYAGDLDAHRRTPVTRVTDKLPGNYMHAALVAALLPNAGIVLCTRNLRDVGWSNFTQRFASGHSYASNIGDIGFELAQYVHVVSRWRELFGDRLHEVRNEVLIADPEREVCALLGACNLSFDARCLSHHEQAAGVAVGTASDVQVREPVSARSVGRHVPFTQWLGPLFEQIGEQPGVSET